MKTFPLAGKHQGVTYKEQLEYFYITFREIYLILKMKLNNRKVT
jgi:hypothetical protein